MPKRIGLPAAASDFGMILRNKRSAGRIMAERRAAYVSWNRAKELGIGHGPEWLKREGARVEHLRWRGD
jgi:hypothetical protein